MVVKLAFGDKAQNALEQRFVDKLRQHHNMALGKSLDGRLPCSVPLEDGSAVRHLDHLMPLLCPT